MRGAWIEIQNPINLSTYAESRSPCGERGLKLTCTKKYTVSALSLPMRGAWIEISPYSPQAKKRMSLPMRGAWIEI